MSIENGGKENLLNLVNKIKDITDNLAESGIEYVTYWEVKELLKYAEQVRENHGMVLQKRIDDEGVVRKNWWGDYVYKDHPEAYHDEEE